jgi:DNA-binding response OmpR family regulator
MHVLVVEDDPRLGRMLRRLLGDDRHVVELAATGRDGLELAESVNGLDAVILDLGLPDMDGLDVARQLRGGGSTVPILMLTARDSVRDRVAGLDAGADDYLVKPFAYEELSARLRALGRRGSQGPQRGGSVLRVGPVALDEARRLVTVRDRRIELSPREFALLECMLRHPDQVLTRDQLLDHAWPVDVAVTLNSVDAYVSFLRRKLGREGGATIHTIRGVGYRMAAE